MILCRPQAKRLARMVSIGRVCSKQQDTLNNESISIYGELWKGSKKGGRYMKKGKGRKGNKIHRKDEESTEGNEEIYR